MSTAHPAITRVRPSVFVRTDQPAILAVVRIAAETSREIGAVRWVPDLGPLEELLAAEERPLVVLDVGDADAESVALVREVLTIRSDARIVLLATTVTGMTALEALRAGVRAFVRTPEGLRAFREVLDRVGRGDVVVPPDLHRDALEELGRMVRRTRDGSEADALLSPREHQILHLLAEGRTTRQIGSSLAISPRTVEGHTRGIYRKLAVTSRVQAVARAAAMGLMDTR